VTVAASGTLAVTFTDDASMGTSAPAACASTYFSMPSLTGVTATGGAATATSSPATDSWTS
jgi:tRNA G26 N,N-dimethylase Trm1